MQAQSSLQTLFEDTSYAWQVLQCQITVELSDVAKSDDIAKLLSLYMAGVQATNSNSDPREVYFRSKATQLMGKQNVIRGLNKLCKANNPNQIQPPPKKKQVSVFADKKKQIEMRIAYETEDHNIQVLKQLLTEQVNKQVNISKAINDIIKTHDQILEDRIKKRKLKAATSPSQSEINQIPNNLGKQQNTHNAFTQVIIQSKNPSQLSHIKKGGKSSCSQLLCQQQFDLSTNHKRRNSFSLNYFFKDQ